MPSKYNYVVIDVLEPEDIWIFVVAFVIIDYTMSLKMS